MSDNSIKLDLSADINRDKFFSYNPELIGTVAGVRFYECPKHGDGAHWWPSRVSSAGIRIGTTCRRQTKLRTRSR